MSEAFWTCQKSFLNLQCEQEWHSRIHAKCATIQADRLETIDS